SQGVAMRQASSLGRSVFLWPFLLTALFIFRIPAHAQIKSESARALPLANQPIHFEPNRGQAGSPATFVVRSADFAVMLRPLGLDLHIRSATGDGASMEVTFAGGDS